MPSLALFAELAPPTPIFVVELQGVLPFIPDQLPFGASEVNHL